MMRAMRRASSVVLVLLCCSLMACSARGELDRMCDLATEVMADESIPDDLKSQMIAKRFRPRNLKVKKALEAIGNAPAERRMPLLQEVAGEGWTCPALDEAFDPNLGEDEDEDEDAAPAPE